MMKKFDIGEGGSVGFGLNFDNVSYIVSLLYSAISEEPRD
jgi:hypothetical protein